MQGGEGGHRQPRPDFTPRFPCGPCPVQHLPTMSSPLRIGVVGCGFIADVIAHAIAEADGAVLVAAASRRRETAEAFAAKHGASRVLDRWEDLVASPDVDAVYVATPTVLREAVSVGAARNGKHVLADKPFRSLPSVQAIASACTSAGVAFLDATHFTHHPRTAQLKRERAERIGALEAVQSVFFFPNTDRSNIRYDASKEPTGAIGDMAWYSMRAAAEFLPADAQPLRVSAEGTRDPVTGTWVRSAGCIRFSDGSTTTWDAGFTVGSLVMDLNLFGQGGSIHVDDYVLDWAGGMLGADPRTPVGFVQRNGPVPPSGFQRVSTPSPTRQAVRMIEHWARMARERRPSEMEEAIRLACRTQGLVDLVAEAVARQA